MCRASGEKDAKGNKEQWHYLIIVAFQTEFFLFVYPSLVSNFMSEPDEEKGDGLSTNETLTRYQGSVDADLAVDLSAITRINFRLMSKHFLKMGTWVAQLLLGQGYIGVSEAQVPSPTAQWIDLTVAWEKLFLLLMVIAYP